MSFVRRPADTWQRDIPGARWFKADLHVHTIDDHPGGRAGLPAGLSGDPADPGVLSRYATLFLQCAIANGVQVIGLTPHSPRAGSTPETSAVWRIVEAWNSGADDDGTPFREKIYAVFPGFEPNVDDGASGIHLLFLFDPEIGCDRYLSLYDAIMDGRNPWEYSALRPTPRGAHDVFETLDRSQSEGSQSPAPWRYIALAPHFQGAHGIFREMRSGVLERFPCARLSGYELGDDKLPSDFRKGQKPTNFLQPFMEEHRQGFFHASDAYSVEALGQRHTWMKLAGPRVEALRQAFIANDSRIRIGFERDGDGEIQPISDAPDVMLNTRPWLKTVDIHGTASFFGTKGNTGSHIRLSPDVTCIIGGSMTGKSTLLDGLRILVGAPLPNDESIRNQVETRGRDIFAAGSPVVEIDCPGSDPTAPPHERWPAQFFAQNELQRLSIEASAVEDILARLVPLETRDIEERDQELKELDKQLHDMTKRLTDLDDSLAEAEQAHARAKSAKDALTAFSEAGVEGLHQASRDRQRWTEVQRSAETVRNDIHRISEAVNSLELPSSDHKEASSLTAESKVPDEGALAQRWNRIGEQVKHVGQELADWIDDAARIVTFLEKNQDGLRVAVERALAGRGMDAGKLREIQELNRQASLLPSYAANLDRTRKSLHDAEGQFERTRKERRTLVGEQRKAFDRVVADVEREFGRRIRATRVDNGDNRPLNKFLRDLRQKGITRWWNDSNDHQKPSPDDLIDGLGPEASHQSWQEWLEHLDPPLSDPLGDMGMSDAVQATFRESITRAKRRELAALRCPDRYFLELRMDDGSYRRLDELSGGQRVSVLLSLLLETEDSRPLVIDQPEDELDNRFLFETVLPALKKLKGRRQVVVATHNANIVVNGDADMVIQLEATAKRGQVACSGAIEESDVRDAIVRTVDGGEEAFRLRRRKYGF